MQNLCPMLTNAVHNLSQRAALLFVFTVYFVQAQTETLPWAQTMISLCNSAFSRLTDISGISPLTSGQ